MDDDPFDELRRGLRGDTEADARGKRPRVRHALAGVGAAVLLALAVVVMTASRPPSGPAPAPAIAMTDPPASTSTAPTVARVWPAERVDVVGNEVRAAGHRWTVGEPGDVVAVGDWDCDGTKTPAVLRAVTGRLHLFDAWATDGEPLNASPGPTVPGDATAIEARGCGSATVRTSGGRIIDVATTAADR